MIRFWLTRNWSTIECGKRAMMPMKMISEMPLPMPRSVICSPEPHHEHRARGQEDDRAHGEAEPLHLERDDGLPFDGQAGEPHAHAPGLERGDDDGAVPRQLGQLLPSFLPFLGQLLEVRNDRTQQLQDDGGADVGHDAEGEDGGVLERAAHEQVVEPEQRVRCLARFRLAPAATHRRRERDVRADADDDQERGGEEQPGPELLDLEDIAETFAELSH